MGWFMKLTNLVTLLVLAFAFAACGKSDPSSNQAGQSTNPAVTTRTASKCNNPHTVIENIRQHQARCWNSARPIALKRYYTALKTLESPDTNLIEREFITLESWKRIAGLQASDTQCAVDLLCGVKK